MSAYAFGLLCFARSTESNKLFLEYLREGKAKSMIFTGVLKVTFTCLWLCTQRYKHILMAMLIHFEL